MKKATAFLAAGAVLLSLALLPACAASPEQTDAEKTDYQNASVIAMFGDAACLDGEAVKEYDYTWHCDPSQAHTDVENAPAEYYTGTKPETDAAVYVDRELYYFPELNEDGFELLNYDGEQEWAYYYQDGVNEDYIFATLPYFGNDLPSDMMHSEAEAAKNKVLHITKPGTYVLEGQWNGQIWVELGDEDETFTDENAKVTLVLSGADISCTVAPGIVFYSAYECDNTWEERESYSENVDTENAGVNVIIADGTENSVSGENVYRMLKTKYKDENSTAEVKTQKKLRKTDGALYSYVSMNVSGEAEGSGTLTVNSGFEGMDSELHLSVLGGNIVINSQDDGMNVNEDDVSVLSFLGGSVTLNAAQGAEGDGVDSNGYIVIDGGSISINGVRPPDSALDSQCGTYYLSGTVTVDGVVQDHTPGDVIREGGGETPPEPPEGMENPPEGMGEPPEGMGAPENFDLRDFKEKVAALGDDATFEDVLAILGMGRGGGMQE